MRTVLTILLTAIGLACSATAAAEKTVSAPSADRSVVRIGLVDTFSPNFYINTYAVTVQYLKHRLPQYRFESVEFASDAALTLEDAKSLDFLVSSAGTFGIRAQELGIEHIVMRKRSDVRRFPERRCGCFRRAFRQQAHSNARRHAAQTGGSDDRFKL